MCLFYTRLVFLHPTRTFYKSFLGLKVTQKKKKSFEAQRKIVSKHLYVRETHLNEPINRYLNPKQFLQGISLGIQNFDQIFWQTFHFQDMAINNNKKNCSLL
jgi:hypothetical protein